MTEKDAVKISRDKVLFIMHMPPPVHGASMMGKYIHDSKLIHEAFECSYLSPSDAKSLNELKKLKLSKLTFFITFHFRLVRLYRQIRPKLCYFTSNSWSLAFYRDFITVAILKLLGANIVIHFHNKAKLSFRNKWYNKLLYRRFFKGIHVIFLAEALAEEFRQYIDAGKIFVCPNGIPETILPVERSSHTPFTFLFLSNMMQEKGAWILLEACAILKTKGYSFQCNYVGQWSDITEDAFLKKSMELGLNNHVKAYGAKYGNEKQSFFLSADAFVFPSFDEAMSLVVLEAMEHSLPCISTHVGGIPSMITDEQSGFLVQPKDADELAGKMAYLLEHPQQAIEMGKTGRVLFEEKFTLQKFEERFSSIIKESIKSI